MSSTTIFKVRPATLRDAKSIAELHNAAAREGLQDEGCSHVSVWVPLANDRAVRFHELAGFKREMSSAKTVAIGAVKVEEIRLKRTLA